MTTRSESDGRIILGAQSTSDAEAALPLLHAYLNWRRGRLVGLFESNQTLRFTVGTRQRVVTLGGRQVPLPTEEVRRNLALRDAQAFRRLLTGVAEKKSLDCDFLEVDSDIVAGICGTAAGRDVAILAQRSVIGRPGPVFLIGGEAPAGPPAFAEALAQALGTQWLALHAWSAATGAAILGRVDRAHAGAIVLDCSTGGLLRRDLDRLVDAARCPVVLFGADKIGT